MNEKPNARLLTFVRAHGHRALAYGNRLGDGIAYVHDPVAWSGVTINTRATAMADRLVHAPTTNRRTAVASFCEGEEDILAFKRSSTLPKPAPIVSM